ncbi:hypothetical protein F4604DRAFT_1916566 [Suillus subluteus]|nr:hypothetical protein F4604DRAFT_1916566 [Suillus subluteus]
MDFVLGSVQGLHMHFGANLALVGLREDWIVELPYRMTRVTTLRGHKSFTLNLLNDEQRICYYSFNICNHTSDHDLKTIYEFDASALKKVGMPFEGHTNLFIGLALSFDCAILASAAHDHTVNLWAYKFRQLLASFDVHHPRYIVFSLYSCQLVYTAASTKIHIGNTPSDILSSILLVQHEESSIHARTLDYSPTNRLLLLQPSKAVAYTTCAQATAHGRLHTDPCENSRLLTNQSSAAPAAFKGSRLHHLWTARALLLIFNRNDAGDVMKIHPTRNR